MDKRSLERAKVLASGIFNLVLVLGVARFSYTPLMPIMQIEANLGKVGAGWLASFNYFGYLLGAIIASNINNITLKDRLYRVGLIAAVLSTLLMGISENYIIWAFSRFIAGLSTAAGLLLGTGLILNWLIRNKHQGELGIHFSGIGLGIAVASLAVLAMRPFFIWKEQWLIFSLLGSFFLYPALKWMPSPSISEGKSSHKTLKDNPPGKLFLNIFLIVYFCAGIGYVVSATFIVAVIRELTGSTDYGSWIFLIMGVSAAPACIIWDLTARRAGVINAIIFAFVCQIVGIIFPVYPGGLFFSITGSLFFGASFVGIVSLVLTMAGLFCPTNPGKMMGKMTVSYGLAQIIGPAVTSMIAAKIGNFNDGLYFAAAVMLIGIFLLVFLKKYSNTLKVNKILLFDK